ncbi:prepilin peptidase [Actibacterium sp. XHP0104]|uniref:A24 family peptidase n=1 Tax=Actibacterium sp. XHP0104 TaxID=2984335 RepID=UPI0021E8A3E7|nr:prepilin peptidase [Actibacterium sp. XHP0104]MCV2880508.1 prepilin peptidase [Actibacterium sp. XHP0104]
MSTTISTAMWFLPFVTPIALWVAWSDMKTMLIPNKAVLALFVVFAVVGLIALPFDAYLWRYAHLVVVLIVGFILNMIGAIGAGDAKFAAVMAPFIAIADLPDFATLFAVVLVATFLLHRVARRVPALRNTAPGWESWERKDFPMGLALGVSLFLHLALPLI